MSKLSDYQIGFIIKIAHLLAKVITNEFFVSLEYKKWVFVSLDKKSFKINYFCTELKYVSNKSIKN